MILTATTIGGIFMAALGGHLVKATHKQVGNFVNKLAQNAAQQAIEKAVRGTIDAVKDYNKSKDK